ncbi:BnaA01g23240D [Brassica napus]|uniref:BnaA01g23240D protein n=2 Tax=Brassica napus TaxID=3708 RepID=A0A078G0E1_BRANA|nr:BnaA01g23240D [Brassica napus]
MDSDDEQCLVRIHERSYAENSVSYEITEDMFEKASTKRQIKGMPLIRHLQVLFRSVCTWHPERRPVMIMEMHVNISGPTKVDVGGNDS